MPVTCPGSLRGVSSVYHIWHLVDSFRRTKLRGPLPSGRGGGRLLLRKECVVHGDVECDDGGDSGLVGGGERERLEMCGVVGVGAGEWVGDGKRGGVCVGGGFWRGVGVLVIVGM